MKFDVLVLPQAERDVDLIVNFLHSKSPRGANAWNSQWLRACETLKSSADSFGTAPEDEDNRFTVQQVIFKTKWRTSDGAVCEPGIRGLTVRSFGTDAAHSG